MYIVVIINTRCKIEILSTPNFEYKLLFMGLSDWTTVILGTIISVGTTLAFIQIFRPSICIAPPFIEKLYLKIPVRNCSKSFSAVNIKIEVAFIDRNEKTYHLLLDRQEFIILPKKTKRTFQATQFTDFTRDISNYTDISSLNNELFKLRVRIHANHEFTGFGKSFERVFDFDFERKSFK